MTTTAAQQVALDNALVPLEKRVEIGKCNMRINPAKTQKEPTYQVVLDALALATCYPAFLITANIDKKRYRIDMEVFREIFHIFPKLSNQEFDALPSDEKIVSFIKELGHKGNIKSITEVVVDQIYQPWRTFASIINKCLSGKITGLDKLRLSRPQILWGMFYKKNVDFVKLLWEEFTFQIENRDTKKQEKMYYPRFTKAIIHHFITKDKSISMRNRMFMHTAEDDNILGPMRFVSKADDYQVYGALLPKVMINRKMRDSPTYKTYLAFATGATSPKKARKFKKPAPPLRKRTLVTVEEEEPEPAKKVKKAPSTTDKSKGIDLLSEAALLEEAQVKKVLKRSRRETPIHQAGGSGDGTGSKPGVPDEPKGKSVDTNKGTGLKTRVPDVSKADSSVSEYESWGHSGDEANVQGDDEDVQESDDDPQQADDERTDYENQETNDDKEESDNEFVHTPEDYVPTNDATNDESNDVDKEEYDRIDKEMLEESGLEMASVQGQYVEQATTTTTPAIQNATTKVLPFSSSHYVSSNYTSAFLNLENLYSTEMEVVSMLDINVQHEVPRTSPLLTIPISVIPEHTVLNPSEIVTTAPAITITSLLSSLFPNL
ncbi:hypothetical protein Tco_1282933 [Tanacetum coccineum]